MDRDMTPSEQPTAPVSPTPPLLEQVRKNASVILILIAIMTSFGMLTTNQSDLKSEISEVESNLKSDIVELRAEVTVFKTEVKSEFAAVRSEIAAVKSELRSFQEIMIQRFDSLEEILATRIEYLEKKTNDNAQAIDRIQQTLNEPSQ